MTTPASHPGFAAACALMFVSGLGIPIMASMNAGVGRALSSPAAATALLYAGGLLLSLILLGIAGAPPVSALARVPTLFYAAPVFVVFYIFAITWAAPRIGVGNAVFFVLLGQLIAAATIDHYALLGAIRSTLTLRRAAGIAVMALGVYLARKPA